MPSIILKDMIEPEKFILLNEIQANKKKTLIQYFKD